MITLAALALSLPAAAQDPSDIPVVQKESIYDDFCVTRIVGPKKNVVEECFFADFDVRIISTPSGNRIYRWEGIRTRELYVNGVLVEEGHLEGEIFTVHQQGEIQINHRDTCFYAPEADVYLSGTLMAVNGELIYEDRGEVASCDEE